MKHKPIPVYVLGLLLFIQAVSGIAGGLSLILKPDGSIVKMPVSSLTGSPFHDFLFPGICLLLLLGMPPALTSWGVFFKPKSRWFGSFNIYTNRHWSWAYSLYIGIMLIIWIDVEVMVIGFGSILQTIYSILAILILMLALMPSSMKYFKVK